MAPPVIFGLVEYHLVDGVELVVEVEVGFPLFILTFRRNPPLLNCFEQRLVILIRTTYFLSVFIQVLFLVEYSNPLEQNSFFFICNEKLLTP